MQVSVAHSGSMALDLAGGPQTVSHSLSCACIGPSLQRAGAHCSKNILIN